MKHTEWQRNQRQKKESVLKVRVTSLTLEGSINAPFIELAQLGHTPAVLPLLKIVAPAMECDAA